MSYDIQIVDPESHETLTCDKPHQRRGGTFAAEGTNEAWLNVTYNYSPQLYRLFGERGIRWLYGKRAGDTVDRLLEAAATLKGEKSSDYWEPCDGNVRAALNDLAAMARAWPDGIWEGD